MARLLTFDRGRFGLLLGPLAACVVLLLPLPLGLGEAARRAGAVTLLMAIWWISEAIPIAATALLPVFLFPLLGILPTRQTCAAYADPTNVFFLGGLMIAAAVERWGLHRRLALHVMVRLGGSPRQIVLGFMTATALISMWTSNAATTMMMLPIALAVLEHFERRGMETVHGFGPALMMTVAYASSIGGVGTLVGTPPNLVFAGALQKLFPEAPAVGFGTWMLMGVPLVILMVPSAWILLTRVVFDVPATSGGDDAGGLRRELAALGPMARPERRVLGVFATTVLLWIFRADLDVGLTTIPGWSRLLPHPTAVDDTVVAVGMATLLFILPSGDVRAAGASATRLLGADWASRIPWSVLVLLGGGFALAAGVEASGLALWLAERLGNVGRLPPALLVLVVTMLLVVLTEFTVNTAITALMMPVLAATATGLGVDPRLLMVPATLGASFGFAMPGGTAPNAIVFASGRLTVAQMARAGVVLDVVGIVVIVLVFYFVGIPALGIATGTPPPWVQAR